MEGDWVGSEEDQLSPQKNAQIRQLQLFHLLSLSRESFTETSELPSQPPFSTHSVLNSFRFPFRTNFSLYSISELPPLLLTLLCSRVIQICLLSSVFLEGRLELLNRVELCRSTKAEALRSIRQSQAILMGIRVLCLSG